MGNGANTEIPTGNTWASGFADLSQLDLNNHSSLVPFVWQVNLAFIILVFIVVTARLFTRNWISKHVYTDDILIGFAALLLILSGISVIIATKYSLGHHVWDVPLPVENILTTISNCIKVLFITNVLYTIATVLTKLSIMFSYLQIFPNRNLRYLLFANMFVVVTFGIAAMCVCIFQCDPVWATWEFTYTDAKCLNFRKFLIANSAVQTAVDFILCAAPLPYFWRMNMPVKRKLGVCLLFCVGYVAFAVSIIRITTLNDLQGLDITYYIVFPLNWTIIECGLGIICVSIPPLRPLFVKILPEVISSVGRSIGRSVGRSAGRSAGLSAKASPESSLDSAHIDASVVQRKEEAQRAWDRELDEQLERLDSKATHRKTASIDAKPTETLVEPIVHAETPTIQEKDDSHVA